MKNILKSVAKEIVVESKEKFVPIDFFKDREGLYIFSGFENNILNKAIATDAGSEFKIASSDLEENASDEVIEKALPEKHIFSETDVCAIVASLIEKQPKGEEGTLLNNGYANLFYTPSLVVRVGWSSYDGEWVVGGWERGGHVWSAGDRVFSPATEA